MTIVYNACNIVTITKGKIMRDNLVGNVYTRLTVLSFSRVMPNKHSKWNCLCECGNLVEVYGNFLKHGKTLSCGCYNKAICTTHGTSETAITARKVEQSTYKSWLSMKSRCNTPTASNYKDYGASGITVIPSWLNFKTFLEDMGVKPSLDSTIERLDVHKGYYKENCRWIDRKLQAQNRQDTIWVTVEGNTVCLAEACRILNLNSPTIRQRIRRGMSPQEAISIRKDLRSR